MKAIIFIPGYRGSSLRDSITGAAVWMPFPVLFRNSGDLQLSIDDGTGDAGIEPTGLMNGLPPFIDVYGPIVRNLRSLDRDGYATAVFAYDWRQSILHSVRKLHECVASLRKRGFSEFNFIAHSMGGMILAYYLRYGIQNPFEIRDQWKEIPDVRNAVFCAVPFRGTVRALEYALAGNPVFLNRRILDRETVSTFPAAYEMMPFYTRSALRLCDSGEPVDLFSARGWQENNIGLFANPELSPKKVFPFMETTLKRAKQVLTLADSPSSPVTVRSLRVLNLVSRSLPTMRKAILIKQSPRSVLIYRRRDLKKLGTELLHNAMGGGGRAGLHGVRAASVSGNM